MRSTKASPQAPVRTDEPALREHQENAVMRACALIESSADAPDLTTLARTVGFSPSHFHRVFKSVTGVTPKAYAVAHRAKRLQAGLIGGKTVTAAMYQAGFGSSGRLYEKSSKMLGMTPSAFRSGGKNTVIRFAVGESSLGSILVAASDIGICSIMLGDDPDALARELQKRFPKAEIIGGDRAFEKTVATVVGFVERPATGFHLPLDIQGTAFQQRVWQALCKIPLGETATYAQIAKRIGRPTSMRAVAQACGANKIAVAIPCHRVIRTDGSLSGYRWGVERKAELLKRERRSR